MTDKPRNHFILAVEGVNGAGKTSLCRLLKDIGDVLCQNAPRGWPFERTVYLKFPTETLKVKPSLKEHYAPSVFLEDMEHTLLPLQEAQGGPTLFLLDRYLMSTAVMETFFMTNSEISIVETVRALQAHQKQAGLPDADLTVLLDPKGGEDAYWRVLMRGGNKEIRQRKITKKKLSILRELYLEAAEQKPFTRRLLIRNAGANTETAEIVLTQALKTYKERKEQ